MKYLIVTGLLAVVLIVAAAIKLREARPFFDGARRIARGEDETK